MTLGPGGRALPSELQQAAPAVQGSQPQAQEGGEEPGPEVLQGPGHGPGLAAAHAQHQRQQDAGCQPQKQGGAAGPWPAGRWGPRGEVSTAGRPDPGPGGDPAGALLPTSGGRCGPCRAPAGAGSSVTPKVPGGLGFPIPLWPVGSLQRGPAVGTPPCTFPQGAVRGRGRPWGAAAHPCPSGTPAEGGALPGSWVLEPWGWGLWGSRVKALNLPWAAAVGSLRAMSGEESESGLGQGGASPLRR